MELKKEKISLLGVASGSLSSILILSEYIAANSRVMSTMAGKVDHSGVSVL